MKIFKYFFIGVITTIALSANQSIGLQQSIPSDTQNQSYYDNTNTINTIKNQIIALIDKWYEAQKNLNSFESVTDKQIFFYQVQRYINEVVQVEFLNQEKLEQ